MEHAGRLVEQTAYPQLLQLKKATLLLTVINQRHFQFNIISIVIQTTMDAMAETKTDSMLS